MAFTKEQYKAALAAVLGIETIAGKGPTGRAGRKALDTAMRGIISGGRIILPAAARAAPVVGRGALAAARANPVGAGIGAALIARQAGLLDPVDEYIQRAIDDRVQPILDAPEITRRAIETPLFRPAVKRKVSKYQKAVKAGMAAVKRSQFLGAKGKLSNAKTAFTRVNKVASAVNKGKKVATKGVTGVIKRAVSRWL